MQIVKTSRYLVELEDILDFIANDSLAVALKFTDNLNIIILDLGNMPYKHRVSSKSNDHNIRDLIYEGYVIPYRINIEKTRIEILGIFSRNLWQL